MLGWTVLPGRPRRLDGAAALAALAFPVLSRALEMLRGPRRERQSWRVFVRTRDRRSEDGGRARLGLQLAFMANEAYERLHAIGDTLVRLGVTRRRLLEWETTAASAARGGPRRSCARVRRRHAGEPAAGAGELSRSSRSCVRRRCRSRAPILALWAAAPWIAFAPQPADAAAARRAVARRPRVSPRRRAQDVGVLRRVRRRRGPLPAAGQRPGRQPGPATIGAPARSPTNIGLGLLATLAAHDLGFIDTAGPGRAGSTQTLTTIERLERFEGHLLNWYDTRTLAPLPPAYVSTVDSGNLAGALLTLVGRAPATSRRRSPPAPDALFDAMNFGFLFDPKRQLFAIGYRLADAEGAGRLDASYYDLLASEARLASFLAIAKGDVPEMHWFHLGRSITSVRGAPVLLSWSATLFEYLMPLLRHAELSGHAARRVVPAGRPPPDRLRRADAACPGASRSRRTTSSIGTATISTRRSAFPGSA